MTKNLQYSLRLLGAFLLAIILSSHTAQAQQRLKGPFDTSSTFTVDGQVALHALMSLSDAHLQKLADIFTLLATTEGVRSGQWERIRTSLAKAAQVNVPGVYWFSRPDGTYWTLDSGRISKKLSDRTYFPRLMGGQTVIGELVVSRSTNRNTAIVAVPVRGANNTILGALGCSVHLDSLTALVRREMGGLNDRLLFYAIDAKPLGALNSNPSLIFTEPLKIGDPGMQQAFREILSGRQGVVRYSFQNSRRTVLYQKSPVTGWWYGFGIMVD